MHASSLTIAIGKKRKFTVTECELMMCLKTKINASKNIEACLFNNSQYIPIRAYMYVQHE